MRFHLYTICWNDSAILGFFFRHYDAFVERYVIYDDGSDAQTLDILAGHPRVEVRPMPPRVPGSYFVSATALRDEMWKESRGHADWVIVTDIDEHLYHPDFIAYLGRCRSEGVTAIPALGYQMIARTFPDRDALLCRDLRRGVPCWGMDKLALFDPDRIEDTHYNQGRHAARLTGTVKYPRIDEMLNLHYKYLGLDYVVKRHAEHIERLAPEEEKFGLLPYYRRTPDEEAGLVDAWDRIAIDIGNVTPRTRLGLRDPTFPRWMPYPPWWRIRWWHLRGMWSKVPPVMKKPIRWAGRAAGLLP